MRKVTVFNFITLNGYFQGLNGDISWHRHEQEENEFSDEKSQLGNTLLFGRVTYQQMASFWPTPAAMQMAPVTADGMNKSEKIVFSRTLEKAEPGNDMTVLGSGSIITQLAEAGLIDEYGFMIDPVALGEGVPVFKGIKNQLDLKLTSVKSFKSGVLFVTYEPKKL